jgi:hypothetical protein
MTRRAFALLLAVAAALRVLFVWQAPFWYDENWTLLVVRLPWDQFWGAIMSDVHPPLYYLILRPLASTPWPWLLRLPSVVFSLLALVVFARILIYLRVPQSVGVATLVLMAVLPMQIWYAQEARMYALLEFLFLAGVLSLFLHRWFWLALTTAAMLYTQNYGLFYVATLGLLGGLVFGIISLEMQMLTRAIGLGITAWIPWGIVLQQQMGQIDGRYWITPVTPGTVLSALQYQFWVSALPQELIVAAWLATLAALIFGIYHVISARAKAGPAVLWLAFAPLVMACAASMLWSPVFLPRALIGSSPFLYLLAAWPLHRIGVDENEREIMYSGPLSPALNFQDWYEYRAWLYFKPSLYLACFALPLLLTGLGGAYVFGPQLKASGDELPIGHALEYIRAEWQPGDVIYHTQDGSLINMLPYSADLVHVRMPDCGVTRGQLSFDSIRATGTPVHSLGETPHARAWVIIGLSPLVDACYPEAVAPFMDHAPALVMDDNEYLYSGVWLEDEKTERR